MIYGTRSPDYVLRLLPESQVMQFVECSEDEAHLLVRNGYISFLAASRCKCTSCRMPTCDGTCPSALKDHRLMRAQNVNHHSKSIASAEDPHRCYTIGTNGSSRIVVDKFSESMWAGKAQRMLAQHAF